MHEEHALCPNGSVGRHGEDGYVDLVVDVEGVVYLQPDDPILAVREQSRRTDERSAIALVRHNAQEARIRQYIAGKQSGESLSYRMQGMG